MVRSFTINSSFIIMHPHHNFSVNNATFQLFPIKITKIVKFWIFWKKKTKQWVYFLNIWKKILWRKIHFHITLSQYNKYFVYVFYLSACNFQFVFSLQKIYWRHISITHTYTHTHTNKHISFIYYGTKLCLPANIYYFF